MNELTKKLLESSKSSVGIQHNSWKEAKDTYKALSTLGREIYPDISDLNLEKGWISVGPYWNTINFTLDYGKRLEFNKRMIANQWRLTNERDERISQARLRDEWEFDFALPTSKDHIYLSVLWNAQEDGDACRKIQIGENVKTVHEPIWEVICPEGIKEMGL